MIDKNQNGVETVFVVDDDEAVRDSLSLLFKTTDLVARFFESGDQFLEAYSPDWCGCVLLDIRMPGTNGLEVFAKLREDECAMPVVFVSGHGDVPMAVDAMRQGAFDFLQKPYSDTELMTRIDQALEAYSKQQDQAGHVSELKERVASLTDRENEVMGHVVSGSANKVIALDLDLSQRTIEVHRARVMEKMQARSLAELVRMSIQVSATERD